MDTAYIPWLLCIVISYVSKVFGLEPSFDVPVINVTVHEGDVAVLPCSVDYLGEHKVVWTDQWSTLLTLNDRRIIDDHRISIERPYTRDWNLHIRNTKYEDRGQYTCQINTSPVKTKTVMLIVHVPAKIIDVLSSGNIRTQEGETIELVCNATGVPTPEIKWFKLPHNGMSTEKERLDLEPGLYTTVGACAYTLQQTGIGFTGEILRISNISRFCEGTYACVAYNEVEPAVSRNMKVFVEFEPEVTLPSRRLGQYLHKDTILDCSITAFPHGIAKWLKNGKDIKHLDADGKFSLELYSGNEESTKKTLSLRIHKLQPQDYGAYTCYARNILGEDRESMILYDYSEHVQKTTTLRPPLIVNPTNPGATQRPHGGGGGKDRNPWKNNNKNNKNDVFIPSKNIGSSNFGDRKDHNNGNRPQGGSNKPYSPERGALESASGQSTRNYASVLSVLYVISLTSSYVMSCA